MPSYKKNLRKYGKKRKSGRKRKRERSRSPKERASSPKVKKIKVTLSLPKKKEILQFARKVHGTHNPKTGRKWSWRDIAIAKGMRGEQGRRILDWNKKWGPDLNKVKVKKGKFRLEGGGRKSKLFTKNKVQNIKAKVQKLRNPTKKKKKKKVTKQTIQRFAKKQFGRSLKDYEFYRLIDRLGLSKRKKTRQSHKIPDGWYDMSVKWQKNINYWRFVKKVLAMINVDETPIAKITSDMKTYEFTGVKDIEFEENENAVREYITVILGFMSLLNDCERIVGPRGHHVLPIAIIFKKGKDVKTSTPRLKFPSWMMKQKLANGEFFDPSKYWFRMTRTGFMNSLLFKDFLTWLCPVARMIASKYHTCTELVEYQNMLLTFDAFRGHFDSKRTIAEKLFHKTQPLITKFFKKEEEDSEEEDESEEEDSEEDGLISDFFKELGINVEDIEGGLTGILQATDIRGNKELKAKLRKWSNKFNEMYPGKKPSREHMVYFIAQSASSLSYEVVEDAMIRSGMVPQGDGSENHRVEWIKFAKKEKNGRGEAFRRIKEERERREKYLEKKIEEYEEKLRELRYRERDEDEDDDESGEEKYDLEFHNTPWRKESEENEDMEEVEEEEEESEEFWKRIRREEEEEKKKKAEDIENNEWDEYDFMNHMSTNKFLN